MEITSQYKEHFGKHDVTGLVGYSYQNNVYERSAMANWDFPSDQYTYNNMEAGAALKRGEATQVTNKQEHTLIGFFARANYNFDNRYLLSASIRHEGSSKFGENHKWGNFPAFSVGWNLFNESFMENTRSLLSSLKFRAGFGITGTVPIPAYVSLRQLGTGDNFLTSNGWIPTIKPSSNSNPDLRWEKKKNGMLVSTSDLWKNVLVVALTYINAKQKICYGIIRLLNRPICMIISLQMLVAWKIKGLRSA